MPLFSYSYRKQHLSNVVFDKRFYTFFKWSWEVYFLPQPANLWSVYIEPANRALSIINPDVWYIITWHTIWAVQVAQAFTWGLTIFVVRTTSTEAQISFCCSVCLVQMMTGGNAFLSWSVSDTIVPSRDVECPFLWLFFKAAQVPACN